MYLIVRLASNIPVLIVSTRRIHMFAKACGPGPTDCTDGFVSKSLESIENEIS